MIRSSGRPTASAELKPKIRSAPGFQKVTTPPRSVAMIASDAVASSASPRPGGVCIAPMWSWSDGFTSPAPANPADFADRQNPPQGSFTPPGAYDKTTQGNWRACMASLTEWKVPAAIQPRAEDYGFDLERALSAVVGVHSIIPPDAFTAETLGTERAGNG